MISKSKVMKTAWKKFYEFEKKIAFGECLVRAWRYEKLDYEMMKIVNNESVVPKVQSNKYLKGWNRNQFGNNFLVQ
jgi:hypothetical protein